MLRIMQCRSDGAVKYAGLAAGVNILVLVTYD